MTFNVHDLVRYGHESDEFDFSICRFSPLCRSSWLRSPERYEGSSQGISGEGGRSLGNERTTTSFLFVLFVCLCVS